MAENVFVHVGVYDSRVDAKPDDDALTALHGGGVAGTYDAAWIASGAAAGGPVGRLWGRGAPWAIGLREAIREVRSFDAWIHPAVLVAIGRLARAEAEAVGR